MTNTNDDIQTRLARTAHAKLYWFQAEVFKWVDSKDLDYKN